MSDKYADLPMVRVQPQPLPADHPDVAPMSAATADVLMGGASVMEAGELARALRHTDMQLKVAEGQTRAELLAGVDRTMQALESYPTTPALPNIELSLPMPVWADL